MQHNYITNKRIKTALNTQKIIKFFMLLSAGLSLLISLSIFASMFFESYAFFSKYPILDFLFGTKWSTQMSELDSIRGAFGVIPLLIGTIVITGVALFIAIPIGTISAIYLSEFSDYKFRKIAKPVLETLAGIPTVVYGFFAIILVAPALKSIGKIFGIEIASESALTAGFVMGIMIIPFISSLVDDALKAVPNSLRSGSYALGATKAETVIKVIFPAALPGIIGSFILAFSRAVGETMIVVMAAGLMAKLSANPLESLTTITVQIVTVLTGDQEFDDIKTQSAFALGIFLFTLTLLLNAIALKIINKYSEKY